MMRICPVAHRLDPGLRKLLDSRQLQASLRAEDSSRGDKEAGARISSATAAEAHKPLGFLGPPPNSGPNNGYVKRRTAPPGMNAAIAWLAAIQDTRQRDEPGTVEVDWLAATRRGRRRGPYPEARRF